LLNILTEGRVRGDPSKVDFKKLKVISIEEIDIPLMHFTMEVVECQKKVVSELSSLGCEIRRDVKKIEHMDNAVDIWAAMLEVGSRGGPNHWENLGKPNVVKELYKLANSEHSDFTFPCLVLCIIEFVQKFMPERLERFVEMGKDMKAKLLKLLGNDTILVFPSYMTPAPKHTQPMIYPIGWILFGIFNMMEVPVTQVPLGLNKNGLPLGIQIVAAPGNDVLTVATAIALEKKFGGWVEPK
jgi:fatty acid amide hydrolase 2